MLLRQSHGGGEKPLEQPASEMPQAPRHRTRPADTLTPTAAQATDALHETGHGGGRPAPAGTNKRVSSGGPRTLGSPWRTGARSGPGQAGLARPVLGTRQAGKHHDGVQMHSPNETLPRVALAGFPKCRALLAGSPQQPCVHLDRVIPLRRGIAAALGI